ncbi:hypothetical protein FO440_23160 [Mucilaginibacter corticis]|uniref:Uncharacterized protein n=1 Tax=Mucilaginibacter corticis TaxID=2597670 RepID=A0A556M932_9SPHI|nr:hypothetical protein [Mucilaginibacter corticis]TSJ36403.1 hypothetical protein FO440_23160 [Mucilaginibacter corticis]
MIKQQNYAKYFRVFRNDTAITEISTNDFHRAGLKPIGPLRLQPLGKLYYGYKSRELAIRGAKAGARSYINQLIALGDEGKERLIQYRMDHYDDLNFNLIK